MGEVAGDDIEEFPTINLVPKPSSRNLFANLLYAYHLLALKSCEATIHSKLLLFIRFPSLANSVDRVT